MPKTRNIDELKAGDILTKTEVCKLFCEKLRISRDSYYRHVYPLLKFKKLGDVLGHSGFEELTSERMPYEIALGIIHKIMDNPQDGDPGSYKLSDYLKTRL